MLWYITFSCNEGNQLRTFFYFLFVGKKRECSEPVGEEFEPGGSAVSLIRGSDFNLGSYHSRVVFDRIGLDLLHRSRDAALE